MQLLEASQWLCIPICRVGASLSFMEVNKELNCWLWWRPDDSCDDDVTRVGGLWGTGCLQTQAQPQAGCFISRRKDPAASQDSKVVTVMVPPTQVTPRVTD